MAKKRHRKQKKQYYYTEQRKMKPEVLPTYNSMIYTGDNPFVTKKNYSFGANLVYVPRKQVFFSSLGHNSMVNPFRGDGCKLFLRKSKSKKYGFSIWSKPSKIKKGDGYKSLSPSIQEFNKKQKEFERFRRRVMKKNGFEIEQEPHGALEKARFKSEKLQKQLSKDTEKWISARDKVKEYNSEGYYGGEGGAQNLISASETDLREPRRAALSKARSERESQKALKEYDKSLRRGERYERLRQTPVYGALSAIEERKKAFKEHALTKGAKKMLTERYSDKSQRISSKVKTGTLGLLNALSVTTSGKSAIPIGRYGGLSGYGDGRVEVKQKGPGRPKGSYKLGLPIKEIEKMQREQKRQAEVQKFVAEQAAIEAESQRQIQAARMPQQPQMQMEQPLNDNQMMQTMGEATSSGFVTPELIEQQNVYSQTPSQMQTPNPTMQEAAVAMSVEEQAASKFNARTAPQAVPGMLIPEQSKIGQPNRPNPWRLRAKWRPNLAMNIFKTITTQPLKFQNTVLKPTGRATAQPVLRPAVTNPLISPGSIITSAPTTSNTTLSSTSMAAMRSRKIPNQNQSQPQYQNKEEEGMLA
ncbi:hypothetical protein M0R04_08940 [Candidatus Dojkabacteria bacterium]|jgi:hypothetical protein|nr:hypothetical protein [Candidatus Dojkabacteria bacterium]